ncbi:MAG: RNA methyltransferase [Chloroflexota bacterium]|jgi:TrmH family RNA methyltransferase
MITSNQNPKIKRIRRLLADRRFRQREGAFVVEGTRWVTELVHWTARPELLLASERWLEDEEHARLAAALDAPLVVVDEKVMATASDTETPSGILAVLPMTGPPLPERPTLLLILDRVADPGNVGTMLRTAAAAGVDGVLLSPGCVDPYNPKAVRATMGALLRLPVQLLSWEEIGHLTAGLNVWLADAGGPVEYTAVDWREPAALVIGSEATGVGPEALALGGERVSVPMAAQTESLNAAAAAAVLLFEARRQRRAG